jgi:hypothetical protein
VSAPLRELFDDLVVQVPEAVAPPELAERAYAGSRRRRRARALRVVSVAASVVLLAALVLPTAVVPELRALSGRPGSKGVDGYPRRIDRQWIIRNLPDRPGPIAALLDTYHEERHAWTEPDGWYAVNERGHRWRIPDGGDRTDQYPNLSRDGRWLGRLSGNDGPYVLHDLVTGRRVEFPQIGSNRGDATPPLMVYSQSPGFWSPDSRRLLLSGSTRSGSTSSMLLLDAESGSLTAIARTGHLAGWSGNDRIIWLDSHGRGEAPQRINLVETDTRGAPLRRAQLRPADPWSDSLSQWSGSVSADGRRVAVANDSRPESVRLFSVDTGLQLGAELPVPDLVTPCSLAWAGNDVVAPMHPYDGVFAAKRLGSVRDNPLVVVSPRVGAHCTIWASDAIGGSPRGGWLLRTSTAGWTWWWREWLLGGSVSVALLWLLLRGGRRRTRGRATPGPPIDWYAD